MKRIQLFEFEDQPWFPAWMRIALTRVIRVLMKMMGTTKLSAKLIKEKMNECEASQIVDLGSGAGGVMIDVFEEMKSEDKNSTPNLILTDLYPSREHINYVNQLDYKKLSYKEESVNALSLETTPDGLKTMFNAFHHLRPSEAKEMLQAAAKSKSPVLIYEMADNSIPLVLWWLFLPISLVIVAIMCLFLTPFVRPLTFKQLIFTYLIPIIPIAYAWDGQASYPRIYTFEDIKELLQEIDQSSYSYEVEYLKNHKGKKQGYYIFGCPKS